MANSSKLAPGSKLKVGTHEATVLKFLLEGGFAHIYKVSIEPAEDDLNIACLKRVLVPDKAGLNTLRKEVDAMKILRHGRNIARYYDSNAERLSDGTYEVLVLMALYPNGSLLDYMNANIKTKLLERQILKIMRDILLGVLEMHRLSLIHRDIKIENVLLDSQDNFILCDFGSTSAPIPPPTNQQEFDSILHDLLYQTTPQYRAPEMLDLNRGFPINDKADIWALGCFLYKLCYYTTPFEAQGQGDVAILSALYVIPPQPEYSSDLKNLIIIMLQENPIMRPNIVQIIMLVCELSREKFADLKVDDFYCQGPYNFLLLQQYQAERQYALNGLLNRNSGVPGVQQQPRSSQTSKYSSPTRLGRLPVVQPGPDHLAVPNTQRSQSAASSDRGNKGSINSPLSVGSDAEDLDGISERFPLLDDMDISKPKSQVHSQVQQLQAHQHIPTQIAQPSGTNYQAAAQFPVAAPPVARVAASFPMATPPSINYPQPPAMLSPQELLKLLRDQLKHYNYLHQKYQYEVGLIQQQQQEYQKQYELYHQQYIQQYQQQQGNQNFANVQPQITPYPPSSTQTVQQSQQSQRLARKEAWESNKTGSIDNQTERLVSDIFGIGGASNSVPSSSIAGEDNILSKSRSHQSTKSVDIRSDVSLTSEPHISSVGPTGSNPTITPTVSNPGRPLSTKSTDNLSLESQITSQEKNSQISNISNDISHLEASIHEAEIKDDPQMDISEIDDNVGKDYEDLIQFEQQFPKALELKDMNSPLPQINLSEFKRFKNPEIQPANDGSANPFPMRSASGISSVQNEDLIKKEPSSKLEKSDRKEDHNPWGDFRPKDTKIAVKGPPLVLSESAKDISKNTESDYLPTASMTEAAQGISNLLISPENSYLMPQNGDSTLKYQTQGSQKALLSRTGSKPTSSQQYSKKVDNNTYQQVAISPELKPLAIKHDAQKAQKSQNGTDYHLSQSPEQFVKEKSRFTQPAFKLDPKGVKPSQFAYHNSNSSDFLVVKEDTADFNADDLLNLQQGTKKWTNGAANSMGLINLEVGLESSSASSTPVQRATVPDSDPGSLIDLGDIAPQQNTGDAKIKPKFVKNRVSLGLQIPSSLNFEEEVIDFDSDDENPNKKSSMSRLAIRNSLKTVKKAERWVSDRKPGERKSSERRSGEFKRSDSSGGEGKKRLSMFLP